MNEFINRFLQIFKILCMWILKMLGLFIGFEQNCSQLLNYNIKIERY